MKKIRVLLERLGVKAEHFGEDDAADTLTEQVLIESVLANTLAQQKVNEVAETKAKEREIVMLKKVKDSVLNLGVEKDKVEATTDLKTLIELGTAKIKADAGLDKNELSSKYQEAQTKLREFELQLAEKENGYKAQLTEAEKRAAAQVDTLRRQYRTRDELVKLGVTDSAMKALDFYADSVYGRVAERYDFREADGKLVAFKRGTDEKEFKPGTSEQLDFSTAIAAYAAEIGIKKETDVRGGGNPGAAGGQQPAGGAKAPYNPYA